jgi:phosphoenolpyruvate carboxykinase (diphosphate)
MTISWKQLGDDWLVEDPQVALGWRDLAQSEDKQNLADYVQMQLAVTGLPVRTGQAKSMWQGALLSNLQEKNRLLADHRAGVDQRIEEFLKTQLGDSPFGEQLKLPHPTLCLDRHGMARLLSLPADGDKFENELLASYRTYNGVVHNPRADRRTTQGTFHVCEGGLPIPADKRAVPKSVFARLFQLALKPPADLLTLPYSSGGDQPAQTFVSLLVRPLVCPAVPGFCRYKTMEVRFFAPGGLVSNLDFVESIFGNAGDPLLPENDAGLDVLHWSGHTGCVILAPHLTQATKYDLGLPHWDDATERQRQDSMCYRDRNEKYNDGSAFKVTCRTSAGVIVTLIADNYFGYCKKEVKTQISYAANLMGNVEEEHAGGTIAFPSYSLGDEFQVNSQRYNGRTFTDVARDYAEFVDVRPEGYGVDRYCDRLIYIPENARASLYDQRIRWQSDAGEFEIALEPNKVYMAPSGYKLRMEKHPAAPSWRLIGTSGEGVVCHKPCTVSGGGKSEISKSLRDYMLSGPIFVNDLKTDFDWLDELFTKDYSKRWNPKSPVKPDYSQRTTRAVLDPGRSLGSVIKLLTPSSDYTPEYNEWLRTIPGSIYAMAFIIKRFSKPEWQGNWREHFSVDVVNGEPGHELKYHNRKLVGMYLRVGLDSDRRWQTYKLRQDFAAAFKIQLEDDITASVVVPGEYLGNQVEADRSYKFVANCEYRLFQRPDDAIHRGLDKQTEEDIARRDNFFCNFEPLDRQQTQAIVSDVLNFDPFTEPMQNMLRGALKSSSQYVVSSAHPRLVDGEPSKNPRYLQDRQDLINPEDRYIAMRGLRLFRRLPANAPIHQPVSAVLSGRRNNPPDKAAGIRSLAVYNPIHYQELPELFMDYVCSLTGKSPSTTGAGSEGALTKSPFNAVLPIHDLNAALVSMILTRLGGYSTAAGFIGSHVEVGHDVSLLVPELWCRLTPQERDPNYLIGEGMLEPVEDIVQDGKLIPASRLGYRITSRFVRRLFGRMFDNPDKVFDERILKPETQDPEAYVDGIQHIVEAQQRVAEHYFEDGSYEAACPPLQAVLSVMARGSWNGKSIKDSEVRALFTRESMLASDWYRARLQAKRNADTLLWQRHLKYLNKYVSQSTHAEVVERMQLKQRIREAEERLAFFNTAAYQQRIEGTLGTDPAIYNDIAPKVKPPLQTIGA